MKTFCPTPSQFFLQQHIKQKHYNSLSSSLIMGNWNEMANFMPFEVVFVLWLHKRQEGGGNNYILRWREKKNHFLLTETGKQFLVNLYHQETAWETRWVPGLSYYCSVILDISFILNFPSVLGSWWVKSAQRKTDLGHLNPTPRPSTHSERTSRDMGKVDSVCSKWRSQFCSFGLPWWLRW